MPEPVSILHLSDLHFDHRKPQDRRIVLDALFADLRRLRSQDRKFDLVVFSGDLVQAGAEMDSFLAARSNFLDPVLSIVGLDADRLILVPGNHDIDASEVTPFIDAGLRSELTSVDKINAFIDRTLAGPTTASVAALSRMRNFDTFRAGLKLGPFITDTEFFRTQIIEIRGLRVGIAALNSAWRATGAGGDKNHLIVSERVVDYAIRDLSNAELRLCVFHHPPDWLLENDASSVENRLYSVFDLVCLGHVHTPTPMLVKRPQGTAVVSQAGTLYAHRAYFNGYQIVDWDELNRTVRFSCQTYFDQRRAFAPAENVMERGELVLKLESRSVQVNLSEVELFLRQARPLVRTKANDHISFTTADDRDDRDDIMEVFVCPPLTRFEKPSDKIAADARETLSPETLEIDSLLRGANPLILIGEPESGRTSLLHYVAVQTAQGVCDRPRVPAILNMRLFGQLRDYERGIRAYFSEGDFPTPTATAVRTLDWTILLDDYDGSKADHRECLEAVRARYPKQRLVVMTNAASATGVEVVLGQDTQIVQMGYLPRRSIRRLSRIRYKGKSIGEADDAAYEVVMRHISNARLPRTGFIVTLVLWAAEKQQLRPDLNEAVLIENLISFLLGKTSLEAALRDKFDPRAQEFLLRAIAVELRTAGGWIESNKLLAYVIDYFEARGLRFGARQVLDQFIACRLLVETEGFIAFRYPCYQDYFVALDLLREPRKFETLVAAAPGELLSYSRELDLWSSLSREYRGLDKALLAIARGGQVRSQIHDLCEVGFTGSELRFKPARAREILDNKPTKDEIDHLLDTTEQRNEPKPRVPPKKAESANSQEPGDRSPIELLAQRNALRLLAHVMRNADHERVESKRLVAQEFLELWSAHAFALLTSLAAIVETHRADLTQRTPLTNDDLDSLLNIFRIIMPASDMKFIARLLSVESLRPIFEQIATDSKFREGTRILAAMAAANNWDRDGIRLLDRVLKSMNAQILRRAALTKMLNDLIFERYRPQFVGEFADVIAELEISFGAPKTVKSERVKKLRGIADDANE